MRLLPVLHNYHVYRYYRWLRWLAERDRRFMAQLHFYTLAELELDPAWKARHLWAGEQ